MSHKKAKTARKFLKLQEPFFDKVSKEKGIYHSIFYHDDWCNILKGTYDCNCNPEHKLVKFDDPKKDEEMLKQSLERYQSWRTK